jgi:tetratricopeptide (TPR) repeat protein
MKPEERHISAAQGYLELGLYEEARAEINELQESCNERSDVVELNVLCCMGERLWEQALQYAQRLCELEPERPGGFIHAAYCLHELGRTEAALASLQAGPASLRRKAVFYYNLACYNTRLGRIEEALLLLRQAFERDPALRMTARNDPDLATLREQLH